MLKGKLMDELTAKTVALKEQYDGHIRRLDGEFAGVVAELRQEYKTNLEELAQKEQAQKDKMSTLTKFFKIDKLDKKEEEEEEEVAESQPTREMSDEEKLEQLEKIREEQKLKKNKKPKKEPAPKPEEVKKISKKEQALHDKYELDLDALMEKYNFKCADLHDLFIDKIISLEKSYGVTVVREVQEE